MPTTPPSHSTWRVTLERTEHISQRTFDEVLSALHAGLGRPNFTKFDQLIDSIEDWESYQSAVDREAGASGLIVFVELDLGSVMRRDPAATPYQAVRIIAGNPVTMESMTRSSPVAGTLAPVTMLLFQAHDGVHVRYDTVTSAAGAELTSEAAVKAAELDGEVLSLIAQATGAGNTDEETEK